MVLIGTAFAVHYKHCDVADKPDQLATARLCKQQIRKNKHISRKNQTKTLDDCIYRKEF